MLSPDPLAFGTGVVIGGTAMAMLASARTRNVSEFMIGMKWV